MTVCSSLVGVLLMISGISKARDLTGFCLAIRAYRIVKTETWTRVVATIVVGCECILGAALVAGVLPRLVSCLALAMLAVFSFAASSVVIRGYAGVPCGCKFLGRDGRIGWYLGLRNISLGCFLLPSAWHLAGAYQALAIFTGVLLVAISAVAADPRQSRLRTARIVHMPR